MISVCNYSFLINQPGIKRGRGFISRKTFHFAFTHLVNGQYTVFKYIMYEISVWLTASRRHDCSTVLRCHQVNILFLLLYTCAFLQFSSSLSILEYAWLDPYTAVVMVTVTSTSIQTAVIVSNYTNYLLQT